MMISDYKTQKNILDKYIDIYLCEEQLGLSLKIRSTDEEAGA